MEPQSIQRTSNTTDKQSVYLLKVNKYADDPILYFLDAGKSLRDNNKDVKIIANNLGPDSIRPEHEDLSITRSGAWIPYSIFGKLRNFLWILRTIYTVIMSLFCINRSDANAVIFLDAHHIALPILSKLTKCKLATFIYYREYLNLKRVSNRTLNTYHCWSLSFSDEIIVPSVLAKKELLYEMDYKYPVMVTTLYPPSEAEHFRKVKDAILRPFQSAIAIRKYYLAIGPWHPSSEFEVTLVSFSDFYDMLDEELRPTIQLTVLGYMYPDDQEALMYREQISEYLQLMTCKDCVRLITNVEPEVKAVLYRISTAIVNTSIGSSFNSTILESLYFGTPTISNNSGFASECLQSGVNGILCDGEITDYAQALYQMKTDTALFSVLPQDTVDIYRRKYSAIIYGKNLLGIVNAFIGIANDDILEFPLNDNKENKEPPPEEPVVEKLKRQKIVEYDFPPVVHLRL